MGALDNLTTIQKFLNSLSWTKITQLAVFLFVIGLAGLTYLSRDSIVEFVVRTEHTNKQISFKNLSKSTISVIDKTVSGGGNVIVVQIVSVDFQKNIKYITHTSIADTTLKAIYSGFAERTTNELPLFTSDANNNKLLVDLINGEFQCHPYVDTRSHKMPQELSMNIKTVCAAGIPPVYGKFNGIVTIYTRKTPSAEEYDQLRALAKTLSSIIYNRDYK